MSRIADHFKLSFSPLAEPDAVVVYGPARFTVLTSRLLRMEYDPEKRFEDRPSQAFWYRKQRVPDFTFQEDGGNLRIETSSLLLDYRRVEGSSGLEGLKINLKDSGVNWQYGDRQRGNLLGTTRTLDGIAGKTRLEPGLLSRQGWALVDDSDSLVFNAQGWLEPRQQHPERADLYFFGHGTDFQSCLGDYYKVAGKPGFIPRWALGNWWSRYYRYTHDELLDLMDAFAKHQVPLAVCIIDMDWHITDTGNQSSGWTGYTWNRELFPAPEGAIAALHDRGLKTALNLHPAEGVHPHEAQYPDFAKRMGIDPGSEQPIRFNCADPNFMAAYFELLHHPHEEMGVDFWWVDWQQGEGSDLPGLDPLWWLNHLHYYDLGRNPDQRAFIFSRWGGLGNHRYPIGFSGDTAVTWDSLAFQPFFTATAANVGYGWWSHDIGGHMGGVEDPELYTRWVQFGVFSPILRLHSTNNPFHERRPWGYDAEVARISAEALRLRHALIPYLYSMAWREQKTGMPLIRPMYHDYPDSEEAYACPGQYLFGSGMVAAPYTSPADPDTGLSRQVVWLPEGDWYQVFSGEHYPGGRWHALYGRLDEIPIFARAGTILPLASDPGQAGVGNPAALTVRAFPGGDGEFVLFEDDGESRMYQQGEFSETRITQKRSDDQLILDIIPGRPLPGVVPERRVYRFEVVNLRVPDSVQVRVDGKNLDIAHSHVYGREMLQVGPFEASSQQSIQLVIQQEKDGLRSHRDRLEKKLFAMLQTFRMETWLKKHLFENFSEIRKDFEVLRKYTGGQMSASQLRALYEVFREAGAHQVDCTSGEPFWVLWNNHNDAGLQYRFGHWEAYDQHWYDFPFKQEAGQVPGFKVIRPAELQFRGKYRLQVNYDDFLIIEEKGNGEPS